MDLDILYNLLRESNALDGALIARLASLGVTISLVRAVRKVIFPSDDLSGGWRSAVWTLGIATVMCAAFNIYKAQVGDPAIWWQVLPFEAILTWLGSMGAWSASRAIAGMKRGEVDA